LRNQNQSNTNSAAQSSNSVISPTRPISIQPLYASSSGDYVYWYFAILFSLLGCVIVYVYFKGKNRNVSQPSIIAQVVASMVALVFFISVFESLISGEGLLSAVFTKLQDFFFLGIMILGGSIGLTILFREFDVFDSFRKRTEKNSGSRPSFALNIDKSAGARELKNAIGSALYSLGNLGDYRLAVLDCYKTVISILERYGMPQRASFTSREFEREVSSRLGIIPSKYLHDLTLLFERARYSSEEFTPREATEARYDLEGLASTIESPTILSGVDKQERIFQS
jgi:hypothetical protein